MITIDWGRRQRGKKNFENFETNSNDTLTIKSFSSKIAMQKKLAFIRAGVLIRRLEYVSKFVCIRVFVHYVEWNRIVIFVATFMRVRIKCFLYCICRLWSGVLRRYLRIEILFECIVDICWFMHVCVDLIRLYGSRLFVYYNFNGSFNQ